MSAFEEPNTKVTFLPVSSLWQKVFEGRWDDAVEPWSPTAGSQGVQIAS